ncbi:MAG: hypothetical protein GXP60_04180 [Epsilonproteobacteria bacterium]|nr:hypothetical protein [Campylobacterota bacterium]
MNQEDATNLLVQYMRSPNNGLLSSYGYEVYLPSIIRAHLQSQRIQHHEQEQQLRELIPHFYAAAWDLCRRGILRPGVHSYMAQATDDGNAGNGYSFTPFGRKWLSESDRDDYVPTEPGRFASMLEEYRDKFGPGFYERAQEAVRCYGAHAYLACCAMCGGASESIILATAIAKKSEEEVLKAYASSNGRSRVENMIIGQAKNYLKREYQGYSSLIKYWRDESAHGKVSGINDNEAYTSIALLLRFAKFASDNWNDLTSN